MSRLAIYLHPARESEREDFTIEETPELVAYLRHVGGDAPLVPVEDLLALVDDPRLRRLEDAHVVKVERLSSPRPAGNWRGS